MSSIFSLSAAESTKITRSYTVSSGDLAAVKTALEGVISSEGKIILVEKSAKVIVQDIPTQFGLIDEVVQAFNAPQPNVRIEIISKTFGDHSQNRMDIRGQRPHRIELGNNLGTSDSLTSQFLVVRSGGCASLEVGQDVPFIDYFWSYAKGLGLIGATQTRWEKIGSQLGISPKVFGNQIQVTVIPQIRKLSSDFFEPEGVISFQTLKTTVTALDGSTIEIGGIAQGDHDFQQHFFGSQRSDSTDNSSITLSASILK
ncbi:MAG: hypothetical protein V4507_11050 [Verrucomicrobiota bacterium]